jgi:hypothetical protein
MRKESAVVAQVVAKLAFHLRTPREFKSQRSGRMESSGVLRRHR